MQQFSLADRVALVTGANRGLGLAIAVALGRAGAHVYVNGRAAETVRTAVETVVAAGGAATGAIADVADAAQVETLFSAIAADHGHLDILVNNVGQRDRRDVFEFGLDDVRRLIDANLVAPFELSRAAARLMRPRGRGRIINITSIAGRRARAGDAAYIATKGGLEALTRAMAMEFGPLGITVNAIAPGSFMTEANAQFTADPEALAAQSARIPLRRWGRPEELASAAVFLASDAAAYVAGHVLVVDGGQSAQM